MTSHRAADREPLIGSVLYNARLWWESKRPIGWSLEEHLETPAVNCAGERERNLAHAVAGWMR